VIRERLRAAATQLGHLSYETRRLTGTKWWRWGNVWFTDTFWAIASYRLSRSAFLALGPAWPATRVAVSPLLHLARPWLGGCEINYRADIGKGLRILHPGLGVVISGKTVIGEHLVLVGGNCIGGRKALEHGDIEIGDNVLLGANACVLGPIRVGDNVRIGACAVVVKDLAPDAVVSAPLAQPLNSAS
jgi:serine O-acetyltransferase